MKLSKIFITNKSLDTTLERLKSGKPKLKAYNESVVSLLFKKCGEFTSKLNGRENLLEIYQYGKKIANKLNFTKEDLEELSHWITLTRHEDRYLGFYLSSLINKAIKEGDVINLKLNSELFAIGAYLKTGKVVVDGYVSYFLGHRMEGGELVVECDAGEHVGNGMKGGKLTVNGSVGRDTGIFMESGDITVYGNIESIAQTCKGRIYQWGRQVWPE